MKDINLLTFSIVFVVLVSSCNRRAFIYSHHDVLLSDQCITAGEIRTQKDGAVVPRTCIFVNDGPCEVVTDSLGEFHLILDPGHYTLTFRNVGKIPTRSTREISVSKGDSVYIKGNFGYYEL